jgi:hypothetical protein
MLRIAQRIPETCMMRQMTWQGFPTEMARSSRGGTNKKAIGGTMKRSLFLPAVLVVLFLLPAAVRADGITVIGTYAGSDGATFSIDTYVQGSTTVGLINISKKVSITFDKAEWQSFVELWEKARVTQSNSFQFIGTYKETGTTYNSLLMMAAGPGVQFVINDESGTLLFVLSPGDYAKFDTDVAKVTATLSASQN